MIYKLWSNLLMGSMLILHSIVYFYVDKVNYTDQFPFENDKHTNEHIQSNATEERYRASQSPIHKER